MDGQDVAYRYVGEKYLQIITPIEDKNVDKPEIQGLIIAMVSLQNCNEMSEYLYDQRDNLVGIFFIITLISLQRVIRRKGLAKRTSVSFIIYPLLLIRLSIVIKS